MRMGMLLMNLTPCTFIKLMGLKGLTKHHLPLIVYMDGNANKKKHCYISVFKHALWMALPQNFPNLLTAPKVNVGRCTMPAAIPPHLCNGYNKVFMVSSAQNSFT